MKYPLGFLLLSFLFSCQPQTKDQPLNGQYILEQSVKFHDPEGIWATTVLEMETREPRVSQSERYSNVMLDNSTGGFSLERNRDERVSLHLINTQGEAQTLLDNKSENDPELIQKYRLQPERNSNYRAYYQFMYGAPMILTPAFGRIKAVSEGEFKGMKVISLDFELTKEMIAKTWRLYFSPTDYRLLGIETANEDAAEGEYLVFNGQADLGNMKLPRFRHWYGRGDDTYRGSDILVNAHIKE